MFHITVHIPDTDGGDGTTLVENTIPALLERLDSVRENGMEVVDIGMDGLSITKLAALLCRWNILTDAVNQLLSKRLGFREFKQLAYRAMRSENG